jgi:PhoPQ-activated pathogenicity-related protein
MQHAINLSMSFVATVLTCIAPVAAHADLDTLLRQPEPVYHWEKRGEQEIDGGKLYDLHLTSQVWQGITWEHRLQIFRPAKLAHPEFCALYNTGGSGSEGNTRQAVRLANETGAVYAILYNIPNQPLYGGKTEDALVVYTWLKYLETGDESWPLHFPMAKAVLKAMDAIQAFTREAGFPPITGFMVHGASKRGWTTWLAGASRDPRIKAIAPMVIDVLNVAKQTPHQLEAYGKLSEQVDDYTRAGIPEKLDTPAGRRLLALEDPYSYRDRLTLPKLLILGTNDRYWSQDALNLYWDDLKGLKWVLYTPNSGHALEDRDRVYATLAAFIRMVAGHGRWPRMHWSYGDDGRGVRLTLATDLAPTEGRLFHVSAKTRDFRDSRWSFEPMQHAGSQLTAHWPAPDSGYQAIFGEAVYNLDGHPFTLSTQIRILGSGSPGSQAGRPQQ